jgi:hypothetical protein
MKLFQLLNLHATNNYSNTYSTVHHATDFLFLYVINRNLFLY